MPSKDGKLQTRVLVREGAHINNPVIVETLLKKGGQKLVVSPRWVPDNETDRPIDRRS
jgi:hypothetical protein